MERYSLKKTAKLPSMSISKHFLMSSGKDSTKSIFGTISRGLIGTDNKVDMEKSFTVFKNLLNRYLTGKRKRLLSRAKAMAIRILNSNTCKHKNLHKPRCFQVLEIAGGSFTTVALI